MNRFTFFINLPLIKLNSLPVFLFCNILFKNTNIYQSLVNFIRVVSSDECFINLQVNVSSEMFMFGFYYERLEVEERSEKLVYDVTDFLAALGGNIGLTLGLSVLHVFLFFIHLFKDKMVSKN